MDEVEVLCGLLEAYSPSGQEEEAVKHFTNAARALGFTASVDDIGNGIARRGTGRPQIMFLGHIDTVDGNLPVYRDGDKLYGRGACDAKGPLVAALAAAKKHSGPGEVVIIAAVGEEHGSRGARFLINQRSPDYLIIGEPSGWSAVTIAYKGTLDISVTFRGERAHLSSPIATPLETALEFIQGLRRYCDEHKGSTPFSSLTVRPCSINTSAADGNETVDVGVNFRIPPGIRRADVLSELGRLVPSVECRVIDGSEAVDVGRDDIVVRSLCAGIRDEAGNPSVLRKGGSSDMNLAVPAWGCPAAAYGPGDSHLDHTNEENVDLKEWVKSVHVLERAFKNLSSRRLQVETVEAIAL